MKMRAYLCAIIQQFEFAPAEDFRMESWEENIVDVYITHHGPLFVNLTSR